MSANIFAAPPATKAVITLILIENSQRMLTVWDDLQHSLPTLLGTMRAANPVLPIPVLWLTTAPVGDDVTSLHSAPPRQYNQLPELKFSFSPDNRVTSRIINRATELMLEAATQFQGGPVCFHLFILAASAPIPGTWGVSVTMPSQIGQSEWRLLGQRIAQFGIHCHMILPASQDISAMSELFTTSLELQGHTQVSPWFPTSPNYTFLLSGDSSALDTPLAEPVEQQSTSPPARPAVLRHQSFPQDVQSAPQAASIHVQTPSLVSSLQKVHGLSRKKLYGTQPPRQPFVREEPVRTKYKSTPTPLSIPVGSQSFQLFEDARIVSKTKVERGRRADRSPHVGDLPNPSSPGRRSPWSRVSSSDVGSAPSSPTTSLSSHHAASPIVPLYPDLAGYPINTPTTSSTFSPGIVSPVSIPEVTFSAPPHDPSETYYSVAPSLPSPPSPTSSQSPVWSHMSMPSNSSPKSTGMPPAARRHSQELPHGSHMQSLAAVCNRYRLDGITSDPRPAAKSSQKVKDAGDVPFIFSPELEAATAAKLKAALQSTPATSLPPTMGMNQTSTFTSGTSMDHPALEDAYDGLSQPPPITPRPFGYDGLQDAHPTMANGHANGLGDGVPRFVGSMSSSSLQGWAG